MGKKHTKNNRNKSVNIYDLRNTTLNEGKNSNGRKIMSYEIVREGVEYDERNPVNFLKWNYKNPRKLDNFKGIIKNKDKKYTVSLSGNTESKIDIESLSGIITKTEELKDFVKNLIPYSFAIHGKIKLSSPYFSRDDDNFYLIQNPCLKETVYKVPMVRGSSWKGAITAAGMELINKEPKRFSSFVRIFGTGSDEYRSLLSYFKEKDSKGNSKEKLVELLLKYLLFELGKKLNRNDIEEIKKNPENWMEVNLKVHNNDFTNRTGFPYLQIHKGRAIFYPSYFDKLSLEVINPHSRKTRAGTNPIHYEVVPKDAETVLQIVYVPFDGVMTKNSDLEEQVKNDLEFLLMCIERVGEKGIGAKTKLGWGRFEINKENSVYCINRQIKNMQVEGWKECEAK